MGRSTDDGLHEGYIETELAGAWPGADGELFAHWDETTGSWWASTWTSTRPTRTGRYRACCAGYEGYADHGQAPQCRHWRGSIVTLAVPADSLEEYSEQEEDEMMLAWAAHVDAGNALAGVTAGRRAVVEAEAELHDAVWEARTAGRTWDEIGRVLGVTRQTAWERFRGVGVSGGK